MKAGRIKGPKIFLDRSLHVEWQEKSSQSDHQCPRHEGGLKHTGDVFRNKNKSLKSPLQC